MGKNQSQIGSSRTSMSLSNDPRPRRSGDQQQDSASRLGRSLTIDGNDRLIVKPARAIPGARAIATNFQRQVNETELDEQGRLIAEHNLLLQAFVELQDSHNLLLSELRRAGLVAGG